MDGSSSVIERQLRIPCADGVELAATHYAPAGAARGAVLVASALGVRRGYYAAFAKFLAGHGYDALTLDYRGIGESRATSLPGHSLRMQEWGALDINAALGWLSWERQPRRLFLVGHSCGGQLPGLAAHSERLDGLVLVAATAPSVRLYSRPSRYTLWTLWTLAIPALAFRREYLPARAFGVSSGDFPSGVTRQWAAWARTPGYLFDPAHGLDTARYAQLRAPILSLGFDDDAYAPASAIEPLLARYSSAMIERRTIRAAEHGGALGHFGFFRERHAATLWASAAEWLAARG